MVSVQRLGLRTFCFAIRTATDTMQGMTEEEIDFSLRCYEQGLDAEDIFERLNEQVPYTHIVQLLADYDDSLMGGGAMEAYY